MSHSRSESDLELGHPIPQNTAFDWALLLQASQEVITIVDLAAFGTIMAMNTRDDFAETFENDARFYLMPIAAAANFARGVVAIAQIRTEGVKTHTVFRAIVESLAGLSIPAGAISSLLLPLTSKIPPALIGSTLGAKALINAGQSVYNAGKASARNIPEEDTQRFKQRAIGHGIGATILTMATAAVVLVMIIGTGTLKVAGLATGLTAASTGTLASIVMLALMLKANQHSEYSLLVSDQSDTDASQASEFDAEHDSAELSSSMTQDSLSLEIDHHHQQQQQQQHRSSSPVPIESNSSLHRAVRTSNTADIVAAFQAFQDASSSVNENDQQHSDSTQEQRLEAGADSHYGPFYLDEDLPHPGTLAAKILDGLDSDSDDDSREHQMRQNDLDSRVSTSRRTSSEYTYDYGFSNAATPPDLSGIEEESVRATHAASRNNVTRSL